MISISMLVRYVGEATSPDEFSDRCRDLRDSIDAHAQVLELPIDEITVAPVWYSKGPFGRIDVTFATTSAAEAEAAFDALMAAVGFENPESATPETDGEFESGPRVLQAV